MAGGVGSSHHHPSGEVLPARRANDSGMAFDSGAAQAAGGDLGGLAGVRALRGTDWMPDLCRSCDQREWIGAAAVSGTGVVGDAAATDLPARCRRSTPQLRR